MKLQKLSETRYCVMVEGEAVGDVYAVTVPNRSYVRWQYAGNPYPRATFRSAYDAARKMVQRRAGNHRQTVAAMNKQPLSS